MSWASADPRDTSNGHRNMIWKGQRKRSLSHKWLFTGTSPKCWLSKGKTHSLLPHQIGFFTNNTFPSIFSHGYLFTVEKYFTTEKSFTAEPRQILLVIWHISFYSFSKNSVKMF